jgi:oxygen-independent coproporphyrinogen-3 oxidase
MLGLYLHVPFCQAICSYCNFNRGLFDAALKEHYVAALRREIAAEGDGSAADTIFFGGGTPSLLEPSEIAAIISACQSAFDVASDVEITLEANPETVTPERLAGFRAAGVNRVSFGVQSFRDDELQRLSRLHSASRAGEAFGMARAAGFDNISLDLMMWLPQQSIAQWLESVDALIALGPDHASLYILELYPNAPLREAMARSQHRASPLPPGILPLGLSRGAAAFLVGVSPTKFDQMVADGRMPRPFRIDGRVLWCLKKLEAAFDKLAGDDETGERWRAAI